jgi:hypothetical protein
LFAQNHKPWLFLFDGGFKNFRDRQRLKVQVCLVKDGAVGSHRKRGAQRFLRLLRPYGDGDHFGRMSAFLKAKSFLNSDFIEGIHGHFDVRDVHAAPIRFNPDFNVVVDDPFDGYEYFHVDSALTSLSIEYAAPHRPVNLPDGLIVFICSVIQKGKRISHLRKSQCAAG